MVLVKAGPAEILRSSQKDELAVRKLQKLCEDVILSLLGKNSSLISRIQKAIFLCSTKIKLVNLLLTANSVSILSISPNIRHQLLSAPSGKYLINH